MSSRGESPGFIFVNLIKGCIVWRLALILLALALALPGEAVQVRKEYREFVHYAKGQTKPWWQRLCEEFDLCEISRADLSVALVIGVSDYRYLPKLETTQNDAREFADFLLGSGEFDQVILLTEQEATRRAIVYFMDSYIPELLQGSRKRNRFLFYFSGHGEKHRYIDRGYLRLADSREGDYTESIGMDTVRTWAHHNTANAVHSLFLIDACMSGIVGQERLLAGDDERSIDVDLNELIRREAGILITAGTEDQPANAHRKWRGSLFNKAVMDGLRGQADRLPKDGVITSRELYLYVRGFVSRQSRHTQTPKHWVLREFESGDFFFLSPGGRPIPDKPQSLPSGRQTLGPGQPRYEVEEIDREYRATTNVRVRSGPGTHHKGLKTLKRGERVWVTGKVAGKPWFQIEGDTGAAYIFSRYLQPTEPFPVEESDRSFEFEPKMVVIPEGSFEMGSERYESEKPVHRVRIRRFAMSAHEITKGQFAQFVKATGFKTQAEIDSDKGCYTVEKDGSGWQAGTSWRNPNINQDDSHPVVCVSWNDAQAYVKWLREKTGKQYRLPSEAEWEYAARAGSSTQYPWGDEIGRNKANCYECGSQWDGKGTAPVGSFTANKFGLYDTVGNVWEWVEDCGHESYEGAPEDGSAWISGGKCEGRVLRGGSWSLDPRRARSAHRFWINRDFRSNFSGFRIAQDL